MLKKNKKIPERNDACYQALWSCALQVPKIQISKWFDGFLKENSLSLWKTEVWTSTSQDSFEIVGYQKKMWL